MATISSNDIKIRYDIDLSKLQQATQQFDKITAEEREMLRELGKLKKQFDELGDKAKKAGKDSGDAIGGMGQIAAKVGPAIAGIFAADKIIGFAKEVIAVTSEFQKLSAVLANTLGSKTAAGAAIASIKDFAASTPFSVQELTNAFVKLANQGFTPTVGQLKKLGDLASSTGKGFDQLAEAIIDAQTGEFERLKDFGIRASKQGDKVTFMFKEQKTTVDFTNKSIRDYIVSLGDLEGVSGASAAIAESLGGQINNLGDSWDSLLNTIGERLAPIYSKALSITSSFLTSLKELFTSDEQRLKDFEGKQYTAYTNFFAKVSDQGLKNVESNSRKTIAVKEKELKILKAKAAEERAIREQVASESRVSVDIGAGKLERLAKKEEKYLTALKAQNQAAIDEIKRRNLANNQKDDADKKAADEKAKADKKEYEAKLKILELEKQQQVLMAQIRGEKLGEVGAERVYAEGVYNLKAEYSLKNIGLTEQEVKVAELQKDKAKKDLDDATENMKLKNKDGLDYLRTETDKNYKKGQDALDKDMKQRMDKTQAMHELELDRLKRQEEQKQAIKQKALELAQTIVQGSFDLYQQGLNKELESINKKYSEEVRLADGNKQKLAELEQQKAAEEKEIKLKQFRAQQLSSIANVAFAAAPEIVKYSVSAPPLAALVAAIAAAQIGFVLAQPVPEFAEGTKGKAFKGGKAMVGERGVEKVITESGKVYFTPPTATLVDLPKGSHVIPNHALSKQEIYWGSMQSGRQSSSGSPMIGKLDELGSILKGLPITQLNMDERGFEKFIRTPRRTTKILNNRFRSEN
jgi:hypothetical protein